MRSTLQRLHYAATVLALAACSPALTIGTSVATDLQPAAYRTYSWESSDQFPTGDPRLDNNALFIAQVQRTTDEQMNTLGLRRVDSSADLVVHFHTTVRERVNVYEVDRNLGYDQRGYSAGTQVQQCEEGTIVIDIADSEGKRLFGGDGCRQISETPSGMTLNSPDACVVRGENVR